MLRLSRSFRFPEFNLGGVSGSTPFPSQIAGAALVPPSQLDLMKAEINRLVVLTNDAVVPVPINVPRRQYIDFHADLYPEVPVRGESLWVACLFAEVMC